MCLERAILPLSTLAQSAPEAHRPNQGQGPHFAQHPLVSKFLGTIFLIASCPAGANVLETPASGGAPTSQDTIFYYKVLFVSVTRMGSPRGSNPVSCVPDAPQAVPYTVGA